MSEKEVSEDVIQKKLEEMMQDVALTKTEQLFAKLLFNVRFDINELKLELLKVFKNEEGKPEPEEIKRGPEDIKTIDDDLEECLRDPFYIA